MATKETIYYCTSTYLGQRDGVGLTYGVQNRSVYGTSIIHAEYSICRSLIRFL